MDINNFLWFVEEREKVRLKKESGLPRPWTEDYILDNCHFLNIHMKYDTGTIRLHQFIYGRTDWEKLFYIFVYRTVYSSPEMLKDMNGFWFHDYRNIRILGAGMNSQKQPYYFFIGKNHSLESFLFNISYQVLKLFWQSFTNIKDASILDIEEQLSALYKLKSGRKQTLLSSIIANDIALQFPGKVNPDSECYISITARQALKKFDGVRSDRKMENLHHSTGLNYSSLNRALSEWWQYLTRKKYFEDKGCLREGWLIQTF